MTAVTPAELSKRFPLKGLHFEPGSGGLVRVVIRTAVASAEMYLHGAHVTSWQPTGCEPVLWMSRASNFEKGKPIRGGVPICFPWFGPHPTNPSVPAHGYARISEWTLEDAGPTDDEGIGLLLRTRIDPFLLSFRAEFGRILRMTLRTELPAGASGPQRFEDALHTYFSVSDVRLISVTGLESDSYIDKVDQGTVKAASGKPIEFTGETDRVYFGTESACVLTDRIRKRSITVTKSGSRSTVVWNPWISKSLRMPDFGSEEWPEMVCIETANVGNDAIELSPGQSHSTTALISVVQHGE